MHIKFILCTFETETGTEIEKPRYYLNLTVSIMKKLTYSIITILAFISIYCLYVFFTTHDGAHGSKMFAIGFISVCIGFILIPTKPHYLANQKCFRMWWYNQNI